MWVELTWQTACCTYNRNLISEVCEVDRVKNLLCKHSRCLHSSFNEFSSEIVNLTSEFVEIKFLRWCACNSSGEYGHTVCLMLYELHSMSYLSAFVAIIITIIIIIWNPQHGTSSFSERNIRFTSFDSLERMFQYALIQCMSQGHVSVQFNLDSNGYQRVLRRWVYFFF